MAQATTSDQTDSKTASTADASQNEAKEVVLPEVILGTMEFGRRLSFDASLEVSKSFLNYETKTKMFDTAFMYASGNSEKYIAQMNADNNDLLTKNNVLVATKANPNEAGGLSKQGIIFQCETSFKRLNCEQCDLFYLHWPDYKNDLKESLQTVNELYKQGKFKRFGISNYSSWQVAEIYYICKANNYVLPTVYQGMYNPLTRDVEKELFPCLRNFGIVFYAYNPLAGGVLTGKHKFEQVNDNSISEGRFHGNSKWAKAYRNRFWKKCYFDGLSLIEKALNEEYSGKVNVVEATLRWMQHHSKLEANDGVILGASSMAHFEENMKALLNKEPLAKSVVNAFEEAWQMCKAECPKYFR